MATDLTRDELRRLARLGAQRRLEELRREEAAIRATFPDLDGTLGGRGRRGRSHGRRAAASNGTPVARKRRKRPPMTAAQKRAVSERMKTYWAERRKAR